MYIQELRINCCNGTFWPLNLWVDMLLLFAYFGLKWLTFHFIKIPSLNMFPSSFQSTFLFYRKLYSALKIVWKKSIVSRNISLDMWGNTFLKAWSWCTSNCSSASFCLFAHCLYIVFIFMYVHVHRCEFPLKFTSIITFQR